MELTSRPINSPAFPPDKTHSILVTVLINEQINNNSLSVFDVKNLPTGKLSTTFLSLMKRVFESYVGLLQCLAFASVFSTDYLL